MFVACRGKLTETIGAELTSDSGQWRRRLRQPTSTLELLNLRENYSSKVDILWLISFRFMYQLI